jgi:hypothetical protein
MPVSMSSTSLLAAPARGVIAGVIAGVCFFDDPGVPHPIFLMIGMRPETAFVRVPDTERGIKLLTSAAPELSAPPLGLFLSFRGSVGSEFHLSSDEAATCAWLS